MPELARQLAQSRMDAMRQQVYKLSTDLWRQTKLDNDKRTRALEQGVETVNS